MNFSPACALYRPVMPGVDGNGFRMKGKAEHGPTAHRSPTCRFFGARHRGRHKAGIAPRPCGTGLDKSERRVQSVDIQ